MARHFGFGLVAIALCMAQTAAQERLDHNHMRTDLFGAAAGDQAAIERLVTLTSKALEQNPDHAQALAWHGATLMITGMLNLGSSTRDAQAARSRFAQGITEIDRAVTLTPDDVEIRSVRGVLMLPLSRQLPPPFPERMLERAREDFQRIFDLQAGQIDNIGLHPLGELLQALGDIYSRQSRPDEAEKYYRLAESKLTGTEYARRARLWLQTRQPLTPEQTSCIGCHVHATPE
jgi:tetratricopeptide (TPR) repeat protein